MKKERRRWQGILFDAILILIYELIPYIFNLGLSPAEFYHKYMEFVSAAALTAIILSVDALLGLRKANK